MCTATDSNSLSEEEFISIKLVTNGVVASAYGVSLRTVEGWASGRPGGPECIRIGRLVRWPLSNLREHIKTRLHAERSGQKLRRTQR